MESPELIGDGETAQIEILRERDAVAHLCIVFFQAGKPYLLSFVVQILIIGIIHLVYGAWQYAIRLNQL